MKPRSARTTLRRLAYLPPALLLLTFGLSLPAITQENPKSEPDPPADAEPTARSNRIVHAGMAAKVVVSSTSRAHEGEGPPEALTDGDLTTRWSSEYAEPQKIELRFEEPIVLETVRLHWEQACATRYALAVSADGETWTPLHLHFNPKAKAEARTDEIAGRNTETLALRLDLLGRVHTNWGFSLYEIEVVAKE